MMKEQPYFRQVYDVVLQILSGAKAFGHPDMMMNLLQDEGVTVVNNKVKDFKNLIWRPSEELL